mmetsp:Transcript_20736/g.24966  ORF Transcript_20736/g.24966 Transcript_20736/m.24966 type:complete len:204 (-) Transcript_20736:400-1011(-)
MIEPLGSFSTSRGLHGIFTTQNECSGFSLFTLLQIISTWCPAVMIQTCACGRHRPQLKLDKKQHEKNLHCNIVKLLSKSSNIYPKSNVYQNLAKYPGSSRNRLPLPKFKKKVPKGNNQIVSNIQSQVQWNSKVNDKQQLFEKSIKYYSNGWQRHCVFSFSVFTKKILQHCTQHHSSLSESTASVSSSPIHSRAFSASVPITRR